MVNKTGRCDGTCDDCECPPAKEPNYSDLIRRLEEAGFEVTASAFADAPTMVYGNLDHASKLLGFEPHPPSRHCMCAQCAPSFEGQPAAKDLPVAVWYRTERDITDEYFTNYSDGPDRPDGEGWKLLCDPQTVMAMVMAEQFRRAVAGPQPAKHQSCEVAQVGNSAVRSGESFQQRVEPWMKECFGVAWMLESYSNEDSDGVMERNHRFIEESLELIQACGATASEAHQLVDYVFDRKIGEKRQEVGGVMVTLAALCLVQKMDMHECGEIELARIWTKIEQIRAKQAAKPKHSPLPVDETGNLHGNQVDESGKLHGKESGK